MEFIPAKTLNKEFKVFGHFYSVLLKSGKLINCRSVLEIVTGELKPSAIDSLLTETPDATFIMMNPGGSKPLHGGDDKIIREQDLAKLVITLVDTKPDRTQYQVMRVMLALGWSHVRVLNLSDLRSPDSSKFIKEYRELEGVLHFTAHSVFAEERLDELCFKLPPGTTAPVICAWGVDPRLGVLVRRSLGPLSVLPMKGLLKTGGGEYSYLHPQPRLAAEKQKWVEGIIKLLQGAGS